MRPRQTRLIHNPFAAWGTIWSNDMSTDLSSLCMESASVLLSSSMIRLDACKLPYCSWNGWPWLWWRPDRPASCDGSRVPWWRDMMWEGAHFWERALRGVEDGAVGAESRTPGGTQIITFLGGSGGECFPPGIHGNFTGWQESGDRRRRGSWNFTLSYGQFKHGRSDTRTQCREMESDQSNATFRRLTD